MSTTQHTKNYNLSQFAGTDRPTWLGDYADPEIRNRIEPLSYPGGNELQYVIHGLDRYMVVVIQALVILFTGAMSGLLRPPREFSFMLFSPEQKAEAVKRESATTES